MKIGVLPALKNKLESIVSYVTFLTSICINTTLVNFSALTILQFLISAINDVSNELT